MQEVGITGRIRKRRTPTPERPMSHLELRIPARTGGCEHCQGLRIQDWAFGVFPFLIRRKFEFGTPNPARGGGCEHCQGLPIQDWAFGVGRWAFSLFRFARYHSTNFGRPALNGVVGLYPS